MKESFELEVIFNTSPSTLFEVWLNKEYHSLMTGGEAICNNVVNDSFSAWDGYITGVNLEIIENKYIKQAWRTLEFNKDDQDSIIELTIQEHPNGCKLILKHSNIPSGQTQYQQGWIDNYFNPMHSYFGK